MKTVARHSLIACFAVAALFGCRDRSERYDRDRTGVLPERDRTTTNEQDKSGSTTLTGAAWVSNDSAIDRIVASRCARELSCSNVGPDKHFTTTDSCVVELRKTMRGDLNTNECPSGIDGRGLDKCLDSIRNESCSNPIEAIGRMAACRTSDLCVKAEMPHR